MTTSEIVGTVWEVLTPYSWAMVIALTTAAGVALGRARYAEAAFPFIVAFISTCGLVAALRGYRQPVSEVMKKYCERKEGYWMIYTKREDFIHIYSSGPMTSSALHERYKTLKSEEGFHVCLPLKDGEKGFACIGRPCESQNQNDQLRDWRCCPVHLSYGVMDEDTVVRLEIWNAPQRSMTLPLSVAIDFLVKAPVGWLGCNTIVGAIDSMIRTKADLKKKLVETNTRFDQAVDALANAVSETKETQRFFNSKGGQLIRQKVEQKLAELLPEGDPRRPRQPDPKIAIMS